MSDRVDATTIEAKLLALIPCQRPIHERMPNNLPMTGSSLGAQEDTNRSHITVNPAAWSLSRYNSDSVKRLYNGSNLYSRVTHGPSVLKRDVHVGSICRDQRSSTAGTPWTKAELSPNARKYSVIAIQAYFSEE